MNSNLFQRECKFFYSVDEQGKHPKSHLPEIAFLGRSNVGKSSLINTLVNRKNLVRTSKTPGSTIKINYFNLADKITLVDLPGHGYTKRSKELVNKLSYLIEGYISNRENLKMIVLIIDSRRGIKKEDELLLNFLQSKRINILLVLNKIDKLKKSECEFIMSSTKNILKILDISTEIIAVSCTKKTGIQNLKQKIIHSINNS
ncbi:ribosome biogenesis GTP-binding protein YihA/YsxC [Rickettsiales endosymbiont of Trichoplax sp. H2]|uniref:ribosome biogenesis GTP-binding protein YihA/YsxC n=1 Tax=Rickettsiales endosymbiont of Trichoplax sp. H2 TaxID=2021221 RepID=UPI0012B4152F|nr:ribosome biogenesis GTP-binding protein YihA/YsxC [Rickettsiales endosymbiont of Trichoplax sp. H2]MSO14057.1 GTP-binding protein EngB [Rickettsiales endosymbiont of Trichoplax sp. H2]